MSCSIKWQWFTLVLCVFSHCIITSGYDTVYNFKDKCDWGDKIEIQKDETFLVKYAHTTLSSSSCTIGFYHKPDNYRQLCVTPDGSFSISNCIIKLHYQKIKGLIEKTYSCNDTGEDYCLEVNRENLYITVQNGDMSTGADLELKIYVKDFDRIVGTIITVVCLGFVGSVVTIGICCYCKNKRNRKRNRGTILALPENSIGYSRAETSNTQNFGYLQLQEYGLPQPQMYGLQRPQNYGPQPQSYEMNQTQHYGPAFPQSYGMQQPKIYGPPFSQSYGLQAPHSYEPHLPRSYGLQQQESYELQQLQNYGSPQPQNHGPQEPDSCVPPQPRQSNQTAQPTIYTIPNTVYGQPPSYSDVASNK